MGLLIMITDLLLLLVLVVLAITGFFQGAIKLLLALLTLYASILLASLYFKFVALYLVRYAFSPVLADISSFCLVLLACFLILLAAGLYTFRYIRLPSRFELLDRIVGMVFGILLGIVASSLIAMLLRYAFIDHDLASQMSLPLVRTFQASTRSARLLPVLLMHVMPQVYTLVAPLLPDAAVPLFSPQA